MKVALRNLGHEVIPILEKGLNWSILPQLIEGADLFLWTRTAGFDPADRQEQGRIIKGLGIPTVGFHLDRWWGLTRESKPEDHGPKSPDPSPFFFLDYLFTADGGHDDEWKSIGANHYWSPPAILSDEAKRVGRFRQDYAVDVGFVGSLRRYGHPEWGPYRLKLYRFLAKTYGGRFRLWEGGIRGQDLADLYASVKVLVGDSCLAGNSRRYWSDRSPECAGRGGFLIHPETEGYVEAFPFIPTYPLGDFDQLRLQIDYYLEHEEQRRYLAEMGRLHVKGNHLYEHRMERILVTVL